MAPKKKPEPGTAVALRTTDHVNLPVSGKGGAKRERIIIPHDTWVNGLMIDSENTVGNDGTELNTITFEVTNPRLYGGTQLRLVMSEKMDKSLDATDDKSLAGRFQGVNFLDAESVWAAFGNAVPLRIHVGHREYTDVETGERKRGYRVAGFYLDDRKLAG